MRTLLTSGPVDLSPERHRSAETLSDIVRAATSVLCHRPVGAFSAVLARTLEAPLPYTSHDYTPFRDN